METIKISLGWLVGYDREEFDDEVQAAQEEAEERIHLAEQEHDFTIQETEDKLQDIINAANTVYDKRVESKFIALLQKKGG